MRIRPKIGLTKNNNVKNWKTESVFFTRRYQLSKKKISDGWGTFRTYTHYNLKRKIYWIFKPNTDTAFCPIYPFDPKPKLFWYINDGVVIIYEK
jgi:hypothetical protein